MLHGTIINARSSLAHYGKVCMLFKAQPGRPSSSNLSTFYLAATKSIVEVAPPRGGRWWWVVVHHYQRRIGKTPEFMYNQSGRHFCSDTQSRNHKILTLPSSGNILLGSQFDENGVPTKLTRAMPSGGFHSYYIWQFNDFGVQRWPRFSATVVGLEISWKIQG